MIFVTGGTGLVGSHLLFELTKSGKKVKALRRTSSDLFQVKKVFSYYSGNAEELYSRIEWVDGDVLDIYSLLEAMEGVQYVYHCAAVVSYHPAEFSAMLKVNQEGTANMVNASLEKKIKKFCHVSSIAALGKSDKEINEETPWKTSPDNSAYAISKYASEREVWRGAEEGLDIVVVNPSVIIGPGHWKYGSPSVFLRADKGFNYYTNGVTGFVDVRDVVLCMMKLMESEIKNQRFIVSAENVSYYDFLSRVNQSLQKKKPSIQAGPVLMNLVLGLEWLRSKSNGSGPAVTKEIISSVQGKSFFSNAKIREAAGIQFMPVEKSIRETAELFRKEKQGESGISEIEYRM